MGVEPTAARSARPATGFEDQGIHRDTTTPASVLTIAKMQTVGKRSTRPGPAARLPGAESAHAAPRSLAS